MSPKVYSVGHSSLLFEDFLLLLREHRIEAIADVRSAPYSRYSPQFDRESLRDALKANGIHYVFLGQELGARTDDWSCYIKGKVQFNLLAQTGSFKQGLERVLDGSKTFRIALMCAEKDPLDCHRTILVARRLVERNVEIIHILPGGSTESQDQCMTRLMQQLRLRADEGHLFRNPQDMLEDAYSLQEQRIAYVQSRAEDETLVESI